MDFQSQNLNVKKNFRNITLIAFIPDISLGGKRFLTVTKFLRMCELLNRKFEMIGKTSFLWFNSTFLA
jgi:hypothetical protein